MKQLNNFDTQQFLDEYWQQKPLLIRNALPDFESPITPDELAGLTCEEDIESRLIQGKDNDWQLTHGPLEDEHFEQLPEHNWTILVQAVDHWVPEVADILEYFRFIPSWRIDDIMVSYASDGGSVGPHYDNYDVFLIQGVGQRLWKLGQQCDESSPLLPHDDLKILKTFSQEQEFLLNPGDILYLPPKLAHWGIGHGEDCMTYSVGFRAPSHADILSHFCDFQLQNLKETQRYTDKNISPQQNTAEIQHQVIDQLAQTLQALSSNKQAIAHWFGQYMTEPKYCHLHDEEEAGFSVEDIKELGLSHATAYKNPASRFAYFTDSGNRALFINGELFKCEGLTESAIESLCNNSQWPSKLITSWLDGDSSKFILQLFNKGIVFYEQNDEH